MTSEEKQIKKLFKRHLKTQVIDVERVFEGLVHFVYKVKTERDIHFVKIRKSYYSALPNIPTDPQIIESEQKALKIFHKKAPSVFPRLIAYIPEEHLIILSDVMPNRESLELKLNNCQITKNDAYNLGALIAGIHKKLSLINLSIRDDKDKEFYDQLLYYRFGYHRIPELNKVIKTIRLQKRQLIIGDLSPKNIGFSNNREFTICDLENAHNGNVLSDIGFLGCSLILHTINNSSLALLLLKNFLRGYSSKVDISLNAILLKKIILGIALYRLDNPVIPYNINLTSDDKRAKVKATKKLLREKNISWKILVETLTNNFVYEN
jgi:hypothetical protein